MGAQVERNQLSEGGRICEFDLKKNEKIEINQIQGVGGFVNMGGFPRDYDNHNFFNITVNQWKMSPV